ncbi:MAG: aspartyl protease family protein [Pseudomonadota bacterium]
MMLGLFSPTLCSKTVFTRLIAVWCVVALQPAHATEQESLALLESERNWPITRITINGQSSRALLDTGATIALIDDDFLAFDASNKTAYTTRVRGIGGDRVLPVMQLASVRTGAQVWHDLPVAVTTVDAYPVSENILPVSLFSTSVVDFDFANDTVTLYDGRPKRVPGAERNSIGYFGQDGLIFIEVSINGVRGHALIDTGSTITFINSHFAEGAKGVQRVQEPQEIRGSDLNRKELRVFEFRKMQLGEKQISNFSIPVLETDLFAALGFGDAPMMVIGMDLLSHYRLQIDRKRKQIILVR